VATPLHSYLSALSERIAEILRERLVGVYLTGSAAVGAYAPGRSDVDVLVACAELSADGLDAIVERCSHQALPCPATKLELVVYELEALAAPGRRPRWSLNFDTGSAVHHVGRDPGAEAAHWFVLDLAFARRHAVALLGPPASHVIGDPGREAVGAAFADAVAWYAEHEPGGPAEIAARRARHWHATGEFATKADVGRD
jgi:hypothetical protein